MEAKIELRDLLNLSEEISKIKTENNINMLKKISSSISSQGHKNESNYILDLIGNESYSFALDKKEKIESKFLNLVDFDERELFIEEGENIKNLKNILANDKIVYKFKGIKIFIEGKPGTGKTTLVKQVAKNLDKKLYTISASKVISSKLGDTQKNIEEMFEDINKCTNSIILFDEFDSFIGSRERNINDEYHRMIGTFNTCFDNLSRGNIFIAITNKKIFIDDSTLRRFNIKIVMNEISLEKIIKILEERAKELEIKFNKKVVKELLEMNLDRINYSFPEELLIFSIFNNLPVEKSIMEILNLTEEQLSSENFSLRDIELITGKSKSSIQRKLSKV